MIMLLLPHFSVIFMTQQMPNVDQFESSKSKRTILGLTDNKHFDEIPHSQFPDQDRAVLLNLLKSCRKPNDLCNARQIHAFVVKKKLLLKDIFIATALLSAYAKCGDLTKAHQIFNQIQDRNVVTWTSLIDGYVRHGQADEALKCFRLMQHEGISPNVVTYICILKACSSLGSLELGKDIHVEIRKQGLMKRGGDIALGNTLVDTYVKCGSLDNAREVFEDLYGRDVVSWNVLLTGYVNQGLGIEVLKYFVRMQDEGILPDKVTYLCVLKACGIIRSLQIGEEIDAEVRKQGLFQKHIVLGNALVDMYARCGALGKAIDVFEKLPNRSVVSWTSLMEGYTTQGLIDDALKCFQQMQDEGISPNTVTYICILKVCGMLGSLEIGEDIDNKVRKLGLLQKDIVLGNTLVNMYAKCCELKKAQEVFEQLPAWDVVSWTSLMFGYAQLGQAEVVLNLFKKMRVDGIEPDLVSFLILLTGCSHGGLLKEGEKLFDDMCFVYYLSPTVEHYACMIDLFGRAGYLDKAQSLFNKVSFSDHLPLLLAILGACHKWVNVKLGRWAFAQAVELDKNSAAAYACMENIYIAAGMHMEMNEIEFLW